MSNARKNQIRLLKIAQELKKEMDAMTEQELAEFKESRRRAKAKLRASLLRAL